jgi:hypothetical protein
MKGALIMNSLAHTTSSATIAVAQRRRFTGWSAIASGVALVIVGEKPYFPASFSLLLLLAALVLYLGMIPVIRWIAAGLEARDLGRGASGARGANGPGAARVAEIIGIAGLVIAVATAVFALPHWLPVVSAQILDTSSLGVIGLWLLAANVLVLGARLFNRVLAVLGVLAGLGWLLAAVVMWAELTAGDLGSLTSTLEGVRIFGGYLAEALYLIWALWLGIWLLVRKR